MSKKSLNIDFVAEAAIRDKKTSKLEAWFWSKVRNVFGDWCDSCGRPCANSDHIHSCNKCMDDFIKKTSEESGKWDYET